MSDIHRDIQVEVEGLRFEIRAAEKNVRDFGSRHFNGVKEYALVFCLRRATDTAKGCDLLVQAKLVSPLYTLTRSLLESLFWVCWIALSHDNAQAFIQATKGELKRIARKTLETGHARVTDKITGEDKTQELLKSSWVKDIPHRLKIESVAKDAGLGKLYTQLYGALSMQAHGTAFGMDMGISPDEQLLAAIALANVFMACVNAVVKKWVVERKHTTAREIDSILDGKEAG